MALDYKDLVELKKNLLLRNDKNAKIIAYRIAKAIFAKQNPELDPNAYVSRFATERASELILIEANRQLNLTGWDTDTGEAA